MDSVLISIITVTYNAAQELPPTLASVEAQRMRCFEHIIVDGASTDGTVALANDYARRQTDVHTTVVSEPDRGLYDAMNKGLHRAVGRYVVFLNAGDRLHDANTLQAVANAAGKGNVEDGPAVVYGQTDIVDTEGRYLHPRHLSAPGRLTFGSFRQGMLVCHQSFYARRDLCPDYDLKYRFSADYDWCVRILRQASRLRLDTADTHCVLTDYLDGGMTVKNHRASLRERFRIMAHHYGWLPTAAMHVWFALRNLFRNVK